jgi:hypothetical protein
MQLERPILLDSSGNGRTLTKKEATLSLAVAQLEFLLMLFCTSGGFTSLIISPQCSSFYSSLSWLGRPFAALEFFMTELFVSYEQFSF